ncbi:MAG: SpoIID/LytB domain-containing protein [Bacillota bacterium]|nr:SpoIID/LytB domain-containing protein [Bacillota bacterium]
MRMRAPAVGVRRLGGRSGMVALVVALAFVFLASPHRSAAAPLNLRIGLAWNRWAADISGQFREGLTFLPATSLWPGAAAPAAAPLPQGRGRYAVATSDPATAIAATESRWLAGAAALAAGRSPTPAAGTAAAATAAGRQTRPEVVRLGGLWYCMLVDGEGLAVDPGGVRELSDAGWPVFETSWPAPPGLRGPAAAACVVRLDGPQSGLIYAARLPLGVTSESASAFVRHAATDYRGRLDALRSGSLGLFSIVNVVTAEDYLMGVVPSEMPALWPLEALKAQAVAARTYAIRNLGRHSSQGFDLCFDIHCQAYGGVPNEHPGTDQAVRATSGVVATYGGRLINAVYHAHSGGATDSSAVIWGAAEPYLVGTARTYEQPYYWTATNTREDVERIVASALGAQLPQGLFPVLKLTPVNFTVGGRATRVVVDGPAAQATITVSRLRSGLGTYRLREAKFGAWPVASVWIWPDWTAAAGVTATSQAVTWLPGGRGDGVLIWQASGIAGQGGAAGGGLVGSALGLTMPGHFVFSGQGFGHGVGMSQWGAREMAVLGRSYDQILKNFYQGISLASNYGR